MFYLVYETTNLINGKYYRGCHITDNPKDDYLGSGTALALAIKKYGKKNFKRRNIAFAANKENMKVLESLLVTENDVASDRSYNLVPGGGYPPTMTTASAKKSYQTRKINGTVLRTTLEGAQKAYRTRTAQGNAPMGTSETSKQSYQTRKLKGNLPRQTKEGARKALETRIKNGSQNGVTSDGAKRGWETRRKNLLRKPSSDFV